MARLKLYLEELRGYVDMIVPVSDEAFSLIEPYVSLRKVKKGDKIVEAGRRPSYVFCVRRGIFRSYVEESGIDRTRWFGVEGDFFTSTYSLSTGLPSCSTIEAIVKGEVWEIDIARIREVINDNCEWSHWLMKMLLDGLGSWEKRDLMMCAGDSYTRFKNFYTLKSMDILSQVPLHHIASYLHVTPQTISQCRRRFAADLREGKL